MPVSLYFLFALAAAFAVGLAARAFGWDWKRSLGAGLVAWPLARLAVNVGVSYRSIATYEVLLPIPAEVLLEGAFRSMWHSFAIPLVGLALVAGGFAAALRVSRLPDRAPVAARGVLEAFALLPGVAAAYILALAFVLAGFARLLETGDESAVFDEMTPALAVVVSLAAGISEEFLYRGILLVVLHRLLLDTAARRFALPLAVALQAVAFGFAHAGYGTWTHILGPTLFGLAMAWVTLRLGLVPAILLHATLNVVIFSLGMLDREPAAGYLLGGIALAALAALPFAGSRPFLALLPVRRLP